MNVTCPQCATIFRVDPAKVPERGVRARCSVCSGLIAVRRPAVAAPAVPKAVSPPAPEPARVAAAPVAPAPPPPPPPREDFRPVPPPPPPPPPAAVEPTPPAPEPVPPRAAEPPVVAASSPPPVPLEAMPPGPPRGVESRPAGSHFSNPFLQQDPGTRARRLARALVSDLVVYHPEKRQRGLAEGTLKELFAEEIRRSWEEYSEQVGEEVASTSSFFTEALNEILAEGRQLFG